MYVIQKQFTEKGKIYTVYYTGRCIGGSPFYSDQIKEAEQYTTKAKAISEIRIEKMKSVTAAKLT